MVGAPIPRRSLLIAGLTLATAAMAKAAPVPATSNHLGYIRYGSGPEPVVVMHEWLGDHHNYDDVLPYLSDDKYTYIFTDLRGYGLSKPLRGDYTAHEAASDVLQLMASLGYQKFHVVGHSMSGMVAQYMALLDKDRLKGLICVSPVPASGFKADEAALKALRAVITDDEAAKKAIDGRTGKRYSAQWLKRKLAIARAASTPEAMAGYLAMFTQTDFADQIKGLDLPVNVIVGEYDVPSYRADSVQTVWGALYPKLTIAVDHEAGHYSMLETPVLFASLVEKALGS